jgi:serine O-acetyltransferase
MMGKPSWLGTGSVAKGGKRVWQRLREDVRTVMERDPAVKSVWEALFCYPGLMALWAYRVAHVLYRHRLYFLARLLSTWARFLTGVDIHPGAQIGPRLFIDHGSGVVIGETAVVGADVTMYQGVTLGGTGKDKGKRHPTVGDRVLLSAGAKVLGNITIGHDAKIGAGAVVLRDVPPGATVVGVPGRVVAIDGRSVGRADLADELPARFASIVSGLEAQVRSLEARVRELEELLEDMEEDRSRRGNHRFA